MACAFCGVKGKRTALLSPEVHVVACVNVECPVMPRTIAQPTPQLAEIAWKARAKEQRKDGQ